MNQDEPIKDGFYCIRTWEDMEGEFGCKKDGNEEYIDVDKRFYLKMENQLPQSRLVYIKNSRWTTKDRDWLISKHMIASPRYEVNKKYEFSNDGEVWQKRYLHWI